MITLRIEHPISDYSLWKSAFDRFAPKRLAAGVLAHRIFCPADDPNFLTLDLDFNDTASAERFRTFLQNEVWNTPQAAPALAGAPVTRILTTMDRT